MLGFDDYRTLINNHLLDFIPYVDEHASTLYKSMRYSLTVGGKRLRPILLLAACDFAGGDINEAMPYACCVEYIHTYSLIHDDLPAMDNDTLRRGVPTNHMVFGEDIAILAGDALLNTAAEVLSNQILNNADCHEKMLRHAKAGNIILSRSGLRGMIAGQVADVENEYKDGTAEIVHFIDEHKCGDLITAPVIAGLHIAGANNDMIGDFQAYAMDIGIGFQILDDILDFEGNSESMGKNVGKDKDLGKCNNVCIHGIGEARSMLHNLTASAKKNIERYGDEASFFFELADSLEKRRA